MNAGDRLYLLVLAVIAGVIAHDGLDLFGLLLIGMLAATHVFEISVDAYLRRRLRRAAQTQQNP